MRKYLIALSAAALFVSAGIAQASAIRIEPGLWQSTVTTKMDGMPFFSGPHTSTSTHCVTRKETDFSPPHNKDMHCTYKMRPLGSHKLGWTASCTNRGMTSHGKGVATFSSTHSKGYMDIDVGGIPGGKTMKMHETFESHRIGACKS